jgi:hypothetical protein
LYNLTLLIVVPAAALLGSLWDGAKGVVIFSTPVYCAVMTIMAKEALAELKAGFSELWLELWPIFAACAAMAAVVFLVRNFVAVGRLEPPLVALVLLSAIGATTYCATLLTIGSPVISEGAQVVGWIVRRSADS